MLGATIFGVAHRLLRAGLHILGITLLVALSAMTVQARGEQASRAANPAPGELIDIGGGQQIHLRTWGDETSGPTIILDASCCQSSSIWAWIAQDLSADYRVVAYDRPGMGWSSGLGGPRDALSAAEALTAALAQAGIGPPYVMVGHSYGGWSARVFTGMHRDEVLGLVLLDTTHPDGGGGPGFALLARHRAWQAHAGVFQLSPPPNDYLQLPADEAAGAYAVSLWTSHLDATADELEAWDAGAAQVRAADDLGDLPLLVASVPGPPDHLELQLDLMNLSTNSRFVQLNASHMAMLMDEAAAARTADEIRQFVAGL